MDLATLIGFIAGSLIILMAIVIGGDASIFVNIPGILVVVGGTAAATFMKFPMAGIFTKMLASRGPERGSVVYGNSF